jgi:hypothetical protein
MENIIFIHQNNIKQTSLDCRPHEELGYDYETHDDYIEIGDVLQTDGGLVNIETLINKLTEMRSHGATHVACDFHCDHVELDLYGVEYRLAKPEEIQAFHDRKNQSEEKRKQREIEALEIKLNTLKGE